ncbi:MAG: hypothetical protein ACRC1H_01200 [Caldilineaceae bacterium]
MRRLSLAQRLLLATGAALLLFVTIVAIALLNAQDPVVRAILGMGLALLLIWVGMGGALQVALRTRSVGLVRAAPGHWMLKFVLFATLLALLEEAVTVSITNAAPLFGVPYGAAYITASGNYFDVVLLHSVVVFVPMFVAWALILRRIQFSPAAVFLLFGLNGMIGEWTIGGVQALIQAPMWIFIYGLMIWLPTHSLPAERHAVPMRWRHIPVALLLPLALAVPVALLMIWLHPISIHFPPLAAGG